VSVPRPYRATAYRPDPTAPKGRRRAVTGHAAAKTNAGLIRFLDAHAAVGDVVDVVIVDDMLDLIPPTEELNP
jgi:hypothetical protein